MMKVHFKIKKEVRTISVPQSADEITLDQFLRLNAAYSSGDIQKILCEWYLLTPDELAVIPDTEYRKLTDAVSWFGANAVKAITQAPLPESLSVPKYVKLFDYKIKLGKKIKAIPQFRSEITLVQTLHFDELCTSLKEPYPHLYAALIAYIAPLLTDSPDKLAFVKSMPAAVAYPLASFFLKRQKKRLSKSLRLPSLSVRTQKWRALSIFLAVLALLIFYIVWLTGTY